jgi:hypothetical protein
MKSNRAMMPTTMFSIARSLHFLAEASVKDADAKEDDQDADEYQIIHR